MNMNTTKNSVAVPRSRCQTSTTMHTPHIRSTGARNAGDGTRQRQSRIMSVRM